MKLFQGVFMATTLQKIGGCDRRSAGLTQLELTECSNKKLQEALTNMPFEMKRCYCYLLRCYNYVTWYSAFVVPQ